MEGRDLYQARPPPISATYPTLLISWWCTGFALLIILVRVSGRYIRTERLFREDKIMAASIIPLVIRMGFVHVILLWGTNNAPTDGLSPIDIQHREIGSRLVLVSRIFYAGFIWTAKLTVLEFLKRIVGAYWRKSYEVGIQVIRYFLGATFVAVIIATLSECQPFDHYWQVVPDPGPQCRQGLAQLLTMGVCDIITDLLLVVYPIPIVIMSTMQMARKISLVLLFALSLALVAITAYRIPSTINRGSAQQYRSLLASLEILAAAGVSNSIVIGSFIRDRGAKKPKYRRESIGGTSLERTATRHTTITQHHWGSDSDLVSGVGMSLAPDLQSRRSSAPSVSPRPVPPPSDHSSTEKGDRKRRSQDDMSISTNSTDPKHQMVEARESAHSDGTPLTPRKMSFFDVGNLMQYDESMPSRILLNTPQHPPCTDSAQDAVSSRPQSPHHLSHQHHPNPLPDAANPLPDAAGLLSPTRLPTDLDRSTAPPPAARHRTSSDHLQPTSPPSSPRNFSRYSSTYTPSQPTPSPSRPPSYKPPRDSETSHWSDAGLGSSMELVDAGGLLK